MNNVFCVFNQKGGVGKTTTAVNLSAALSILGKKILLIDFDPQCNASTGFNISDPQKSVYDFIFGDAIYEEVVTRTAINNLDIIPSSQNLSGALIELVPLPKRDFFLKKALENADSSNNSSIRKYDYIFIDCAPSLCLLSLNALIASSSLLIPLQAEYYALEGLSKLIQTVQMVKEEKNTSLEIDGIVLTMFDRRNLLNRQVEDDVRKHLSSLVYQTRIPRSIKFSEASSFGNPIMIHDPKNVGSDAYFDLAREFLSKRKMDN